MSRIKIPEDLFLKRLGATIKIRREHRYTDKPQREVAESAGVHRNTWAKVEKGSSMSVVTLLKICNALNCEIRDVIPRDED